MRDAKYGGTRSFALLLLLIPSWAHAATAAGNGFRRLPDIQGGVYPNSLTITRTQVIAATKSGLFTRPLGGSAWTPQDTGNWTNILPLLPNGDTLLAVKGDQPVLSTNRGKTWNPAQVPGDPLLLCRSGLYCQRRTYNEDSGLYVSRDLGITWVKLSGETISSLAAWKNGIAGVTASSEVFKMDPATGTRTPLSANLPHDYSYFLFNVGDSLFAQPGFKQRLFKCQAGSERWIPVWDNTGNPLYSVGYSPFGITGTTADSIFWSRDFGKTWRGYPYSVYSQYGDFVAEENRLWATSNPMRRIESNGTSWVVDVAGMLAMIPWSMDARGNRLFVRSDLVWYQTASPDSAWVEEVEPENGDIHLLPTGESVYLMAQGANHDKMIRIDPDGRRTTYPTPGDHILGVFAGSRDRIYVSLYNEYPLQTGSFGVAVPNAQSLKDLTPFQLRRPMEWFAMDGDRIVTGISSTPIAWSPFYSPDAGNTWDTCPIPGEPRVSAMIFAGGAFLGFTSAGLYRSADPPAGWARTGDPMEMLLAHGDTVVARDPTRLLLTLNGGRAWSSVETPHAPETIKSLAFVWGSLCLVDTATAVGTAGREIVCGSLSDVDKSPVDGLNPLSGRGGALPKLRLNWGRIQGALPGGHGREVSAGVDGRIGPALRARLP